MCLLRVESTVNYFSCVTPLTILISILGFFSILSGTIGLTFPFQPSSNIPLL